MTTPPPSSDDYQHSQTIRGMEFECEPLPARGPGGERGQTTPPEAEDYLAAWTPEFYRDCRTKLGFSQEAMAEVLGVTSETIHQRETGKTKLKREAMLAMQWLMNAKEFYRLSLAQMDIAGNHEEARRIREFLTPHKEKSFGG